MLDSIVIPPGLVLLLGAALILFAQGIVRHAVIVTTPLVALYSTWFLLPDGEALSFQYIGFELIFIRADGLARLFATVFILTALVGGFFALKQNSRMELSAAFAYAGSAIGVVFAGDLLTLFVFWELMAITSTLVVLAGGAGARSAAIRYGVIHFFGGVLLMAGVAGEIAMTGDIAFTAMDTDSIARWLILAGFLVNAGAPPLSAWLPDAYPQASWSGTVFLSAFTTKTAVYVLMRGFPGEELLIFVGLYMIFYGIIYAILENDIRRILVYSIVNQVGFMVTGIGIGTAMALNGAAAHAFAHIIYKALLLMSAGSVLYMTGKHKFTDLGGLFRTMPITMVCGIIGAFSMAAVPFTSGFVSKTMITQGAIDEKLMYVWVALSLASAVAFLYAALKFPWFVFFHSDSGLRPEEPPWNMRWAMVFLAFLCIALGVYPQPLYDALPFPVDYVPYTADHIVAKFQLLFFAGFAFFILLGWLKPIMTITLDFDWFYRGLGHVLAAEFSQKTGKAWAGFATQTYKSVQRFIASLYKTHGPEGVLARTWPTGVMAFWTSVLLAACLIIYIVRF